jgi:hypothetical protein
MSAACIAAPFARSILGLGALANEWIALGGVIAGGTIAGFDAAADRAASRPLADGSPAPKRGVFAARAGTVMAVAVVLASLVGIVAAVAGLQLDYRTYGPQMDAGLFEFIWYGLVFVFFAIVAVLAGVAAGLASMTALLGIASAHVLMTVLARSVGPVVATILCLTGALGVLFATESIVGDMGVPTAPFTALLPVALAGAAWLVQRNRSRQATYAALGALGAAALAAVLLAVHGITLERERIASRSFPLCEQAPVAGIRCISLGAEDAAIPDGTREDADVARDLAGLEGRCIVRDEFAPTVYRYADTRVARPADVHVHARVSKDFGTRETDAVLVERIRKAVEDRYRGHNGDVCGTMNVLLSSPDVTWVGSHTVEMQLDACDAGGCFPSLKGPPVRYFRNVTTEVELVGSGATGGDGGASD